MKKIFIFCATLLCAVCLSAQTMTNEKFETVYMKNDEVKVGSITAINDVSVSFIHRGETLVYTLKKPDIVKIVFSSGRMEMINNPSTANNTTAKANVDHHNKAAVLPFAYI